MSEQLDFLRTLADMLIAHGIEFMLAGSTASSYHGEPRATRDVDLVIEADETRVRALLAAVQSHGWYASEEAARVALRARSMFNVIDPATGWKADLIVRRDRPFSREEFRRRMPTTLLGAGIPPAPIATAEDTVLAKLEWHRETGSTQQFRDAVGLLALRDDLDLAYLRKWARELDVVPLLDRAISTVRDERG